MDKRSEGTEHALQYLWDDIKKEIKFLETDLGKGQCRDIAEYKLICGQIRGYALAAQKITELAKKMEEPIDE